MAESSDLSLEGLVHDLTNVFESIASHSELLARDPAYARMATKIERSARQGMRLLSSYLEQSLASLELDAILDRATDFARDFVQLKRGALQLDFARRIEEGLRLPGNPAAWERVFMNLFLNAAQAMEAGGTTIEITASRTPRGVIEIAVSDDGPGISPKVLPRLFEPGVSTSTRARRSGLGLHIVKTIVEQHRGTVAAANNPAGKGARFAISLPPATAAGDAD